MAGAAFSCSNDEEEESTWTMYLQDFVVNYNLPQEQHCTLIASQDTENCNNSLVSDAGVGNRLSLKKRKKVTGSVHDHDLDLEDTATSPANTPKIPNKYSDIEMISKQEKKAHIRKEEDGSSSGQTDSTNEVGLINGRESDYTQLKNKGLCLVPLSMVTNFFA